MASSNFIAQSGLMKSGEAYTYSFRCVNVCFCAVGETLVSIETSMQNNRFSVNFYRFTANGSSTLFADKGQITANKVSLQTK